MWYSQVWMPRGPPSLVLKIRTPRLVLLVHPTSISLIPNNIFFGEIIFKSDQAICLSDMSPPKKYTLYVCIYIFTYTYIHLYIYIYICRCMYICNMLIFSSHPHQRKHTGPKSYFFRILNKLCSWTTTPNWPCRFLHFLTLFTFSCTLPHLSHATLLVFACFCSATLLILSWGGVGEWGGGDVNVHIHFYTCHVLRYWFSLVSALRFLSFPGVVGGVGWDVNVHLRFHTCHMLR